MSKSMFVVIFFACLGTTVYGADLSGFYQTNGCVNYEVKNKTIWSNISSINLSPNGQIVVIDQVFEGSDCKTPYFVNQKDGTYIIAGDNIRFKMGRSQFITLSAAEELKSVPSVNNKVEEGYFIFDIIFISTDKLVSIDYGGFSLTKIAITQK